VIWLLTIPITLFLVACWALCAAGGRAEDEMELRETLDRCEQQIAILRAERQVNADKMHEPMTC
jgi:hypothetical protein